MIIGYTLDFVVDHPSQEQAPDQCGLIQCVSNSIYLPVVSAALLTSLEVLESNLKQHWWFSRMGKLSCTHLIALLVVLSVVLRIGIGVLVAINYPIWSHLVWVTELEFILLLESCKSVAWAWFDSDLKIWKKSQVLSADFTKISKPDWRNRSIVHVDCPEQSIFPQ